MDMRQEIDAQADYADAAVATTPVRPTRPERPKSARPSARPMMLNNPIVAPDEAADLKVQTETPKVERPARPEPAPQMARPERPKAARRARVLEPDQVAASRGEAYEPPGSDARDAALGTDDAPEVSKLGGVLHSFGQIAARLKKSKSEDIADVAPVAEAMPVDVVEAEEEPAPSAGVLGSLRGLVARSKKDTDADAVVPELDVAQEPVEMAYDYADEYSVEATAAYVAPKRSIMARFDTPVMGVLAAVLVSCAGLVGVSALFG